MRVVNAEMRRMKGQASTAGQEGPSQRYKDSLRAGRVGEAMRELKRKGRIRLAPMFTRTASLRKISR